ncbi:MAG: (d)CMP kinase [Desulfobacterales bacterium]|nr:(d)CMP kinase [Desulfobacterales bacterium]
MKKLLITIDGPAGAGKSTVSRALAERLGYRYVDTGALYRGVAYVARHRGVAEQDDAGLSDLLDALALNFILGNTGQRLTANGEDITDAIRTPEISMLASAVSARPVVREVLLRVQRELGRQKAAVFEGRDMGTVVFPDADVKFFLDASTRTRAQRRFAEAKDPSAVSFEAIERDMRQRDRQDSTRALAPLKAAADAVVIDSTELTIDQVVEQMLAHVRGVLDRG